jgi:hypothetical protein
MFQVVPTGFNEFCRHLSAYIINSLPVGMREERPVFYIGIAKAHF